MINFQNFFVQPRNEANPKIARMEETIRKESDDGILYHLVSEKEKSKYKILSDDEVMNEFERSLERRESEKEKSRSKHSQSLHPTYSSGKQDPRSLAKENKDWEKEIESQKRSYDQTGERKISSSTASVLFENSLKHNSNNVSNTVELEDKVTQDFTIKSIHSDLPPTPVNIAIETMTSKYMENIHVIKQLMQEKQEMEGRMVKLERQLQRGMSVSHDYLKRTQDDADLRPNADYASPPPYHSPSSFVDSSDSRFDADLDRLDEIERSSSGPKASTEPDMRAARHRRPSSANPRLSQSRTELGNSLQADIDKFVQKRRQWEENERKKKYEEEAYKLTMQQRFLRASHQGKDFSEMQERQRIAAEKSRIKREQEELKRQEEEREQERLRELEKKRHLSKPVIHHDVEWKDYAKTLDMERKERIERRKQEMLMKTTQPVFSSALEEDKNQAMKSSLASKPKVSATMPESKPFHAEDPEKITQRLKNQQHTWEMKLKKTKDKIRDSMEFQNIHSQDCKNSRGFIESMEKRQAKYAEKRRQRLETKKEQEDREMEKKMEDEARRVHRLLSTSVPEAGRRLTNTAEMRLKKLKEKTLMEKKQQALEDRKRRLSQEHEKEVAKHVREIVKAAQPVKGSKISLTPTDPKRPSLIERFYEDESKKKAQIDARQKVVSAIAGTAKKESLSKGVKDVLDLDDLDWLK